jgi:hypothetical protein
MKFTKKTIYIGLFSVLYLIVAFSSFFHACAFFGLANNSWMSIILAFAFEVGQAAVLFSLLTSTKDRSRVMPWVLMFMFTLVQVIGNVYSSYKYIVTNSIENLRYFKEPIFIWTSLPDDQATVIIVYVVGAILPIAALFLTSMITNYLTDEEERQKELEQKEVEIKPTIEEVNLKGTDPDGGVIGEQCEDGLKVLTDSLNSKDNEIEQLKKELEELKQSKENTDETEKDEETLRDDGSNDSLQQEDENVEQSESTKSENDDKDSIEHIGEPNGQESDTGEFEPGVDDTISEGTGFEEATKKELDEKPVEENIQKRESHFINL